MTTPNKQPTPPPGMEIWKLPPDCKYWSPFMNEWIEVPKGHDTGMKLTYAIPTHPATGDEVGFIPKKERERLNKVIQNISEHAKPVEQRQELDLSRLIRSIPCDVRKHVSYHDLKRIVENYNAQ